MHEMQLAQLYHETVQKLAEAGIDDPSGDADQLLGFCLGLTRSELFLNRVKRIDGRQLEICRQAVDRRLRREPLHYIMGTREFWSLDFSVTPAVLIPRPETEFLLEQVLKTLAVSGYSGGTIVDMCTGSGIIAVVLALELEAKKIIGVDASEKALRVAAANIARHKKIKEIDLVCSDLFAALNPREGVEIIVANPPYVAEGTLAALQPEVRDWEPPDALTAGLHGLDVIQRLADQVPAHLLPGGWLFVEIGADQKEAVHDIFSGHGSGAYECVEVLDDWAQKPRVLKARKRKAVDGKTDY